MQSRKRRVLDAPRRHPVPPGNLAVRANAAGRNAAGHDQKSLDRCREERPPLQKKKDFQVAIPEVLFQNSRSWRKDNSYKARSGPLPKNLLKINKYPLFQIDNTAKTTLPDTSPTGFAYRFFYQPHASLERRYKVLYVAPPHISFSPQNTPAPLFSGTLSTELTTRPRPISPRHRIQDAMSPLPKKLQPGVTSSPRRRRTMSATRRA
jgi:hypothetical protein